MISTTDMPTCHHFTQNNPAGPDQADVAALLRRVAASIEQLGQVEIQDLVFHNELTAEGDEWPRITVYFHTQD